MTYHRVYYCAIVDTYTALSVSESAFLKHLLIFLIGLSFISKFL